MAGGTAGIALEQSITNPDHSHHQMQHFKAMSQFNTTSKQTAPRPACISTDVLVMSWPAQPGRGLVQAFDGERCAAGSVLYF